MSSQIRLLQGQDVAGAEHPDDLAYPLAAQLLTAQANLAPRSAWAGAAYCPASDQAGQGLRLSLGFDEAKQAVAVGEELVPSEGPYALMAGGTRPRGRR